MRSFPILSIGAALGASMMRMRPLGLGSKRVRKSKYVPHQGAKERERAKRLYESHFLNQQFVDHYLGTNVILSDDQCHERCTPTLCQMSKRQYATRV